MLEGAKKLSSGWGIRDLWWLTNDLSWPGSSRPSTSCLLCEAQDVDARNKSGHDERESDNKPHVTSRNVTPPMKNVSPETS
jgi:hypothetical protein